jgi:ectoine hydroxylase-related dioxygenase (phytanoyl-CoA dioxygenase family)
MSTPDPPYRPELSGASAALNARSERFAAVANRRHREKRVADYAPADPSRLSVEQKRAWEEDGFFVLRGRVSRDFCRQIDTSVIETVRRMDRDGTTLDATTILGGSFTVHEENFQGDVERPEDRISKLYNLHREDLFRQLARREDITQLIGGLLGRDVDVFNSQYIFKNTGAWGQPWHQDALYFDFDRFPQVGMWLATSPSTLENGCLYVVPGSHREPIHEHLPDRRPGANLGYLEVRDYNFSAETPLLMEPGDVLLFHSFLMHRSVDNTSTGRRTAVVYHYGAAGTRNKGLPSPTLDWMPVLREGAPIAPGARDPWAQWRTRLQLAVGVALFRLQKIFRR